MKDKLRAMNINIRVTEPEYNKINQFAAEFNLPTGMYLRLVGLLGHLPYRTNRSTPTVSETILVTGVKEKHPERRASQRPLRRSAS